MIGVDLIIEEALTVRDQVGRVSEVTWSKVQATSTTIARTQGYALRQLDAIAEKLGRKADLGKIAKATQEAEPRVREWLAVLARTFQLQDGLAVLELDRVRDASPDELDAHRLGLSAARRNRRELIARSTSALLAQMDATVRRGELEGAVPPGRLSGGGPLEQPGYPRRHRLPRTARGSSPITRSGTRGGGAGHSVRLSTRRGRPVAGVLRLSCAPAKKHWTA